MRRKGSSLSLNAEPRSLSDDELRPKARGREAARKLRRGGGLLMRMGAAPSTLPREASLIMPLPANVAQIARSRRDRASDCRSLAVQMLRTFMNSAYRHIAAPDVCDGMHWRKPTPH
jgi:hypothetical protein